jgi:ATP-dependent Clp protease protease subunit
MAIKKKKKTIDSRKSPIDAKRNDEINKNKRFWSVRNEVDDDGDEVGHLYLYGVIASESWWGDEVTPNMLRDDIEGLGDIEALNVHIFSNGGDVFAGLAIYAMLKQQKATVNIYIEGIAASIASIIAMAGDNIYISNVAMVMIHNPLLLLWGYYNADALSSLIKDLSRMRGPLIAAYTEKTGLSKAEIIEIMDGEDGQGTWFTAEEAIEASFADEYIPEESDEAQGAVAYIGGNSYEYNGITLDLSMYGNAPKLTNGRRTSVMSKINKMSTTAPKAKAVKAVVKNVVDETISATCPDCEATFDVELPEDAEDGAIVTVTCPECGSDFDYDTGTEEVVEDDADDDTSGGSDGEGDAQNASNNLVIAERNRILALDELLDVHPEEESIINNAKKKGTSYAVASRQVIAAVRKARNKSPQTATTQNARNVFLAGIKTDGDSTKGLGVDSNSGYDTGTGNSVEDGIAKSLAMFQNK